MHEYVLLFHKTIRLITKKILLDWQCSICTRLANAAAIVRVVFQSLRLKMWRCHRGVSLHVFLLYQSLSISELMRHLQFLYKSLISLANILGCCEACVSTCQACAHSHPFPRSCEYWVAVLQTGSSGVLVKLLLTRLDLARNKSWRTGVRPLRQF